MTNSREVAHENWLVRCFPRAPGFSRSNPHKIDGLIMVLDGKIKHLVLLDYGLFDKICSKIKYLISKKSGITSSINHNFGRIKIDSSNSLSIKKILTFHNIIILIKSVIDKNENKYY